MPLIENLNSREFLEICCKYINWVPFVALLRSDQQRFLTHIDSLLGCGKMTVVDNLHVRCEICSSVIKLGAVFAPQRFLRHFELWHSSHKCAGSWLDKPRSDGLNCLSKHDLACLGESLCLSAVNICNIIADHLQVLRCNAFGVECA